MAMAAEMVAIGVAKKAVITTLGYVVKHVVKLIKDEWCLKDSVKEGLRSLKSELEYMQACIGDVPCGPQDRINLVDKIWLTNVKELASAIDTGLQSFVSRIEPTKGKGALAAFTRQSINRDIDSFIKEKMAKAKEVSEQRARYGSGSSQTTTTTSAQKVDPRLEALFRKESDHVGLEEATEKLIQMLSSREHVSIVGMGGMGKTTLARVVHGKLAMSGNFDYAAFLSVGQQADVDKVLMNILEELEIGIYYRKPDTKQLMKQLQDSLKGKRCLFVFDDIWEDKTWELIKYAFVGTLERRIITTTRKVEVAKPFDDGVYMIKPLSPASSKELLHTRLFGAEATTHHFGFSSLSDKILGKCGGVPLAISMIAGLLVKKPSHEWSKVYDSIGFGEHEDVETDISTILSYSYYDLSRELQQCFLYLSLFPEGQWIGKNMLIWRWVAEGLVLPDPQEKKALFRRGEEYFKELAGRSMIQREVSPRDLGQGGCRVHKIMLDLIRRLCEEEKFCTVIGTKRESTPQTSTIHRLAIHKTRLAKENDPVDVGEVRSFYASTCSGSSLPPLSQFKRVRVLDLEGCDLSDGDRKLKHLAKLRELAYVGLLGTPVAKLPKEIGDLKLLQTLDVTGTGMEELPKFVEKLKRLRCLRAGKGTSMKGRVGALTSLEELWLHSADKSPDFAAELRKLIELRVLVIHLDEIDEGMQEKLVESLHKLDKLQILQVWSDAEEKVRLPCWEEIVPFPELRQLLLFGIVQSRLMPWIHFSCVPELTKLLLEVEVLEAQDLEILGQMRSLQSLYLHSEDGNKLWYTAGKDEFRVLEYLYTNIELVCGDGGLPKIQELEVAGIRVGTDVGLSVNNMPLLEKASYHLDCKDCGPEEVRQAEAHLRQAGEAHPNHPTVSIQRFNNLELEIYNQCLAFAATARFSGAGHEVQTTNSLPHILEYPPNVDLIYKAAETFGAPPTLVVGDAGTGSASSRSSPSPVVEISTDGTKSHIVESMALDLGKHNAALSNMTDDYIKRPDIVAMMNNAADGSLPASEFTSRMMQEIVPDIISQLQQNACSLQSGAESPLYPMRMMMMMSSTMLQAAMLQAANCMSGTQDWEINEERFAAAFEMTSEMASNVMRIVGMDAAIARNIQECIQSPEYVECMRSMTRNPGGPQFGFELSKAVKLFNSATMSSMPQETDLPAESGEDAYVNLAGKLAGAAEHSAQYLESLTEVTADGVLSWLNTQDGAAFLSETSARRGISQVAFRKLLEKHLQKPEMIASLNSTRRSRGCSGMARLLMQQLSPDFTDHFIEQSMPLISSILSSVMSMLGYTGGGGPADVSGMLPGSLSNLAVRADPTAELASMDAAARTSASVSSTGQPSSKPDNVGIEEGGTE